MAWQTNPPIDVKHDGVPVDEFVDAVAEAAWAAEIRRHIAALDAGAPSMSWEDARERIASA